MSSILQAICPSHWVGAATRRTWGWPALTGLLLGLAFPTDPQGPLALLFTSAWAWVALVPLLAILSTASGAGFAFRRGWLAGGLFTLITMYWVAGTQGGGVAVVGGTLLMAVYLGLFTGAFAAAQALAFRCLGAFGALAAPVLWTATEYVLSLGELGFPWLLLGHSQAANPALIQYAEFTGAYGVSFCVVAANGLFYLALAGPWGRRRRLACAAAAVAVIGVPGLWGRAVLASAPSPGGEPDRGPVIGLVQNDLGLEKWRPGGLQRALVSLEDLSRRAAAEGAGLIVWPETALPCRLDPDSYCRQRLHDTADELQAAIFTGAPAVNPVTGDPQNGAFLIQPGVWALQSYAKMHLVPFGERTPFRDRIPFLRHIDWSVLTGDLGPAEFSPGTERTLFKYTGGHFGALICFESVFPDLVRGNVTGPAGSPGADFLVIITNDSWFGATAGPYQHARIAALRAVENRIAIARCATSGISLFIDAFGRAAAGTSLYEQAVRVAAVAPRRGTTAYTRHGDIFARTALAVSIALVGWCAYRRRLGPQDHA